MTNEELALAIKAGQTELIPQLWEQVERFVVMKARQYYRLYCEKAGCEVEDLIQCAYFALLNALHYHDPARGYSFLTILGYSLRAQFAETSGIRLKADAMINAKSLDKPTGEDGDTTLLEQIANKASSGEQSVENMAIEPMYQQQLHEALLSSMEYLTERQREVIDARYFKCLKVEDAAELLGCHGTSITHTERKALDRLYQTRKESGLSAYLEHNTNYHTGVGFVRFKDTQSSIVERLVIKREELAKKWMQKNGVKS